MEVCLVPALRVFSSILVLCSFLASESVTAGSVQVNSLFEFASQWKTTGHGPKNLIDLLSGHPSSMIEVVGAAGGNFMMGRRDDGDDAQGYSDELPRHQVTLSAFQIGKYEVTNGQYAAVLNYALSKGYLKNSSGGAYGTGGRDVYHNGVLLINVDDSDDCQISFGSGVFAADSKEGISMANYPVVEVSWFGTIAFCNWLSEMEGRAASYNLTTQARTNPFGGGYRLPTEAEWEFAAGWGGSHKIYGTGSDTLTGKSSCNYTMDPGIVPDDCVNPSGFGSTPCLSPVGWFNGVNISPNGNVHTVDSRSPSGCYDMSGNAAEICEDWYLGNFYGTAQATQPNPVCTDPLSGFRVLRGGGWIDNKKQARTASRYFVNPEGAYGTVSHIGFRVVRSN